MNNATIQFRMEKIPVERDAELTFSAAEDVETSSIMRIEGKFVNPLQVGCICSISPPPPSRLCFILGGECLNKNEMKQKPSGSLKANMLLS